MSEWVREENFIEADVIRWREPVWEQRGPKQGRLVKIGDREVTAEVMSEDPEAGWVWLLVRDCLVLSEKRKNVAMDLKKGETVKRKRSTVSKGRPWRLLWSDESARAALVEGDRMRPRPSREERL